MTTVTFATDEEIRAAHDILLPGKPEFEEDKVAVIKSNQSQDIKACPGSGKTTVLLAKLSILSDRMPFADGSGICVLTHTNVAIDEIKARFGGKADLLFSYPNFCGTIQAFVDRFLTIPFFNSLSPNPLTTIDDDRAISIIRKAFYSTNWEAQKALNHLFRENKEYQKACQEKRWKDVVRMKADLVTSIYLQAEPEKYFLSYGDSNSIASYNPKKPSLTYQFLHDVRLRAFHEGVLKYEDAFSVAMAYHTISPSIREALSKRFKYLFMDEVQDSSRLQLDLIEKIFDREQVVVQRYGDEYQAIYNSEDTCAWSPVNPLPLDESKRFGEPIAKILRTVCVADNRNLQGNANVHSLTPLMLVYTDSLKVLPTFARLIKEKIIDGKSVAEIAKDERRKDTMHRVNIKAVGFVGKEKEKDGESESIQRYFPNFENVMTPKRPFGENITLNTFLQKNATKENPQLYRNQILDALVTVLEKAGVRMAKERRFTKSSMLEHIENAYPDVYEQLNIKLSEWVLKISCSEYCVDTSVFDSVKGFITGVMPGIFGFRTDTAAVKEFIKKEPSEFYELKSEEQSINLYRDGELEIEVATVHSVKGETHAATLFLETKYYKYESEHFGAQLCGEPYRPRRGDSRVQTSLKVAYVAMSRPKYLLAYAIHKDRFGQLDRTKLAALWDVVECD